MLHTPVLRLWSTYSFLILRLCSSEPVRTVRKLKQNPHWYDLSEVNYSLLSLYCKVKSVAKWVSAQCVPQCTESTSHTPQQCRFCTFYKTKLNVSRNLFGPTSQSNPGLYPLDYQKQVKSWVRQVPRAVQLITFTSDSCSREPFVPLPQKCQGNSVWSIVSLFVYVWLLDNLFLIYSTFQLIFAVYIEFVIK